MSESESLYGNNEKSGPPPKAMSLMDQFVGVFTEPSATFRKLREAPSWVPALALTIIVSLVVMLLWAWHVDMAEVTRRQMEMMKNTFHLNIPDSAMDDAIARQDGKHPWISAILGPLLGTPIIYLIVALIVWGFAYVGRQEEGEAPSFVQAFSVTVVHSLVTLPSMFLAGAMALVQPVGGRNIQELMPTVLSFFVKPENGLLRGLFGLVDPLWIFSFVVLALGMKHALHAKGWAIGACLALFGFFGVAFRILGGFAQ